MFFEKINNLISSEFKIEIKAQTKLDKNVMLITLSKNKISYESTITGIISEELFLRTVKNMKERLNTMYNTNNENS